MLIAALSSTAVDEEAGSPVVGVAVAVVATTVVVVVGVMEGVAAEDCLMETGGVAIGEWNTPSRPPFPKVDDGDILLLLLLAVFVFEEEIEDEALFSLFLSHIKI